MIGERSPLQSRSSMICLKCYVLQFVSFIKEAWLGRNNYVTCCFRLFVCVFSINPNWFVIFYNLFTRPSNIYIHSTHNQHIHTINFEHIHTINFNTIYNMICICMNVCKYVVQLFIDVFTLFLCSLYTPYVLNKYFLYSLVFFPFFPLSFCTRWPP